MSTAMVWQREYPLDPYYDRLMTAAVQLYAAGSDRGRDGGAVSTLGRFGLTHSRSTGTLHSSHTQCMHLPVPWCFWPHKYPFGT